VPFILFFPILAEFYFLDELQTPPPPQNFTIIRPLGADLFHADRWTGMTNLIAAFCSFVNAPKKHVMDTHINIGISRVGVLDMTIAYITIAYQHSSS